ncbi:ankyrin repeat protein mann-cup isoform X1 [Lycorma delicatula]|uniref:ankyrin repeat protein mann-cup isoform X1 n=1 Tax=Lycorma delicatula TaxID=130591 RepID=UPI003F519CA7
MVIISSIDIVRKLIAYVKLTFRSSLIFVYGNIAQRIFKLVYVYIISVGSCVKQRVNMWFNKDLDLSCGKVDLNNLKDVLFNDLIQECKHAAPGARLSYTLRTRLERYNINDRRDIVCRVKDGCAPLFIACKRGHVEIVEYLIVTCNADIEQRGLYEVPDDRSVHHVTPLWCAAVSGKLPVIRCLVQHGADVNAVSDSGSTPVRSACFMTHLDIVSYLVECGADILKTNYNGGTCLINSVQSVQLCVYLLEHGASVNARDIQNKTALHYAIQEHRFETTKLLLDHGADPFARSRYNDDALQTACLKGALQIFCYLIERIQYPPERLADAHELLGSTFLDEHTDTQITLMHWQIATKIRYAHGVNGVPLPKRPVMPPRPAFNCAKEFTTEEELRNIAHDLDAIRMQSLLICERVLGPHHKDTLFRLMYRGAAYADDLRYQCCIDLWRRALEIRVEKDSVLYSDTCFTAQALVRLFVDLNEKVLEDNIARPEDKPRFSDVLATFNLLADKLSYCRQLLDIRPVYKRQQESFDRILKCITHLIYLLAVTMRTPEEKQLVHSSVKSLIQQNPRSACTGDTLLHLCVSRLNTIKSSYFADDNQLIFPNMAVIQLLLNCGAPVNARNESRSTPLHVAANPYNFYGPLVRLLLDHGAHLDQPNRAGDCPTQLIAMNPVSTIPLVNYISLRCLAATAIVKNQIPYIGEIPATLQVFVGFHEE